jgi:hypothetical protein
VFSRHFKAKTPQWRELCVRILVWQGDHTALKLHLLGGFTQAHPDEDALIDWAIDKTKTLESLEIGSERRQGSSPNKELTIQGTLKPDDFWHRPVSTCFDSR